MTDQDSQLGSGWSNVTDDYNAVGIDRTNMERAGEPGDTIRQRFSKVFTETPLRQKHLWNLTRRLLAPQPGNEARESALEQVLLLPTGISEPPH